MTERVDFYVLGSATDGQRDAFACRLAEKAYLKDMRVLVWCADEARAQAVDELLWTFNDRSFVPHRLCGPEAPPDASTPVHVACELGGVESADLLVNLSDRLPDGLERFARIAEVIDADGERRRRGRERFKAYRERALAPHTHQLDETGEQ